MVLTENTSTLPMSYYFNDKEQRVAIGSMKSSGLIIKLGTTRLINGPIHVSYVCQ